MTLLDDFLNTIKRTRGADTYEFYKSMLEPLQGWLQKRGKSIESCVVDDIYDYLDAARVSIRPGEKWKTSSKNALITALKRFVGWQVKRIPVGVTLAELRHSMAEQQRCMQIKDMDRYSEPKRKKRKALTPDQVIKLLKAASKEHRKLIFLLAYLSFRKGEFKRIKELDLKQSKLVVLTEKTDVPRTLYFNSVVRRILEEVKRGQLRIDYDPSWWNWMLAQYKNTLGFKTKPKMFRSTFETEMQRSVQAHLMREAKTDADLHLLPVRVDLLVKTLMGHTTEEEISGVYTEVREEDIKRAMLEWHFMQGWGLEGPPS